MKKPKIIRSSADPTQVSMTVRGILLALVPVVMATTGITEAVANEFIDSVVQVVFLGTSLLSAVWTLWGLARKVYNRRWAAE